MLTITAFDFDYDWEHDVIDLIMKSIPLQVNNDEVKVEENGTNGIGWFNFSYRVQNSGNKNTHECSIDPVATTVMNPLPTSCTSNESVSIRNSTNQLLDESSVTTVDNSTDQPLAVSPSSLWALIAVAIMLLLTLLVTIIIAICIVRNMSMKLKETKERNASDVDDEHTVNLLRYC